MYQVDMAASPPLLSQSLGHSGEGSTSRGPSLFVSLSMSYTSCDPEVVVGKSVGCPQTSAMWEGPHGLQRAR